MARIVLVLEGEKEGRLLYRKALHKLTTKSQTLDHAVPLKCSSEDAPTNDVASPVANRRQYDCCTFIISSTLACA
jgi:hypothetical protein